MMLVVAGSGCANRSSQPDQTRCVMDFHEKARMSVGKSPEGVVEMLATLGDAATEMGMKDFRDIVRGYETGELHGYEIIESKIEGDCALILIVYRLNHDKKLDPERIKLIRQQGRWKYVPFNVQLNTLNEQYQRDFRLLYKTVGKEWQKYCSDRNLVP